MSLLQNSSEGEQIVDENDLENDMSLYGDEEDEFDKEDWEGDEEEEDDESAVCASGSARSEDEGEECEEDEGEEGEREDDEEVGEEDDGDFEEEEEEEEAEVAEDKKVNDPPLYNAAPAIPRAAFGFGSAPASSAFSSFPVPTAGANARSAFTPSSVKPAEAAAAAPSAFGQASVLPSPPPPAYDGGSNATSLCGAPPPTVPRTAFLNGAPQAAPTPSSATLPLTSHPQPVQSHSPTPPSTASQGKSAAAMALQFVDFKRSFGQKLRRARTADEEALEVNASLARYELVVPTDKYDDVIEKALYGC